jgi:hypothetical protein
MPRGSWYIVLMLNLDPNFDPDDFNTRGILADAELDPDSYIVRAVVTEDGVAAAVAAAEELKRGFRPS